MDTRFTLRASLLIAALFTLPVTQAANTPEAEHSVALHRCEAKVGDDRALCTEAVEQDWKAHHPELAAQAAAVRGAGYDAALKKCDPLVGDDRARCTEAARQEWPVLARPADKMPQDGAAKQRQARYTAELAKCEPKVGDDLALCTEAAKQAFGPR